MFRSSSTAVHFLAQMDPASASQFNLKLTPAPWGLKMYGVNGEVSILIATVKVFTIANASIPNGEFVIGGSSFGDTAAVLGQNFLGLGDVEYDFATGTVRLLKVKDCSNAFLGYWIKPDQSLSEVKIDAA